MKYYKRLPLFQLVLLPILSQDHRISPAHSQITFLIPLPPLQLGRACGPNTGREGQQKPHRTPKGSPHLLPMASRMRSSVMFCACWTPQARSLMISQGCLTRSRTKISITESTHLLSSFSTEQTILIYITYIIKCLYHNETSFVSYEKSFIVLIYTSVSKDHYFVIFSCQWRLGGLTNKILKHIILFATPLLITIL